MVKLKPYYLGRKNAVLMKFWKHSVLKNLEGTDTQDVQVVRCRQDSLANSPHCQYALPHVEIISPITKKLHTLTHLGPSKFASLYLKKQYT